MGHSLMTIDPLVREYLRLGYSNIVVLSSRSEEKSDFHATEYTWETIIARKGEAFVRAEVFEKKEFGPGGDHRVDVNPEEISEAEYRELAKDKAIVDDEKLRSEVLNLERKRAEAKRIRDSLEANAPTCPSHNIPMKLVRGPKAYFWGCPKYKKCNEKHWLTDEQKTIASHLDKLPA